MENEIDVIKTALISARIYFDRNQNSQTSPMTELLLDAESALRRIEKSLKTSEGPSS